MRISERGAVYDGYDRTIGFRCQTCGDVVPSMLGDICNRCWAEERRHQELLQVLNKKP